MCAHHEQRGKTERSRCGSSDGAPVAVERTPVTAAPQTPMNTGELRWCSGGRGSGVLCGAFLGEMGRIRSRENGSGQGLWSLALCPREEHEFYSVPRRKRGEVSRRTRSRRVVGSCGAWAQELVRWVCHLELALGGEPGSSVNASWGWTIGA